MFRSFLMKLGLLMVTAGLVLWIGWPGSQEPRTEPEALDTAERVGASATSSGVASERSHTAMGQASPRTKTAGPATTESRLDLNRATVDELVRLPGVGRVLAQRILAHRQQRGAFTSVDELLAVKGIGKKRLAGLRGLVVVSEEEEQVGAEGGRPSRSAAYHGRYAS